MAWSHNTKFSSYTKPGKWATIYVCAWTIGLTTVSIVVRLCFWFIFAVFFSKVILLLLFFFLTGGGGGGAFPCMKHKLLCESFSVHSPLVAFRWLWAIIWNNERYIQWSIEHIRLLFISVVNLILLDPNYTFFQIFNSILLFFKSNLYDNVYI